MINDIGRSELDANGKLNLPLTRKLIARRTDGLEGWINGQCRCRCSPADHIHSGIQPRHLRAVENVEGFAQDFKVCAARDPEIVARVGDPD